eukprot:c46913_g1_i1.p3 GENE.c46913_g1_i1~~c46913_g1_i1.p3  ORF type:complete len:397 (-),score=82.46 c46913_g1_i1:29-1189(-)
MKALAIVALLAAMAVATPTTTQHAAAWRAALRFCPSSDHEALSANAHFYFKLHAERTFEQNGAVFDCVPFLEQPSLALASDVERAEALELLSEHRGTDSSLCPRDHVALVRHRTPVKAPADGRSCLPRKVMARSADPVGYQWVMPKTISVVQGASFSQAIFNVGESSEPLATCAADGQCHSLNQLWWLTTNGGSSNTCSLETGWIASNYFTTEVTTSIFVFSTNDGYGGNKDDQYNMLGGFTLLPGAPVTPGQPLPSVAMNLRYLLVSNGSYILQTRGFTDNSNGSFTTDTEWASVGFYRTSRYPAGDNDFKYNEAGCEVYYSGGSATTASGRLLGWGTSLGTMQTTGLFQAVPQGSTLKVAYTPTTWTNPNSDASKGSADFTGNP